jgi:hypothetical protein
MNRLSVIVLLLLPFVLAPALWATPGRGNPLTITSGTVYDVASVGELSAALTAANNAGVPATILLADNTYQLAGLSLVVQCPGLIVRSASGNRDAVVLRGPDEGPSATQHHVFLLEASNVTIADLTLGYCRYHGIQIRGENPYDVSGTRIHNCRIVNCNEQFIKGSGGADRVGATDGVIENCLFEFTSGWAYQYYTGGIDIHRGVNWVVRDNVFRSIRNPTGLPNIAEHAIHFWKRASVPQNITVERNWIINCDRGIGFGLSSIDGGFSGGNSVIRNNFVVNDGAGGHTDVGIGLEHANNVRVDNNTVYIPTYWAPVEYRFDSTRDVMFRNNLVNKPIQLRSGAPPALMSSNVEKAQASWFRNIAEGDLHLMPTAAEAINGGVSLDAFQDDIESDARPALDAWDVGADEYVPTWSRHAFVNPATFADEMAPNCEIHVATTGSDVVGDGSEEAPYATIDHASKLAVPGCAVIVAPGVYPGGEFIADLAGTVSHPIWIRGSSETNRPVIEGGGVGLHLTRVRYLVVENLEVRGSANNGINCDDGGDYANPAATQYVLFRNLYIHDIGSGGNQDGLKLSGVDDYAVQDCDFFRTSTGGSGIDHVGCHNGIITGCTFSDMGSNAIQCKGGSSDITIRSCRFINGGQRAINLGGSTGFPYFRPPLSKTQTNYEARSIYVVANIFRGADAPVAFVGCIDSLVAHNTFIDPKDWFFRILQETVTAPPFAFQAAGHSGFVNNLLYFDSARMKGLDINVGSNTAPHTFLFVNNLWHAYDNPGASKPDLPGSEIGGLLGVDPLLADPANDNYTITLGSPAARSGVSTGAVFQDFSGDKYLNPPSIGAFELSGDLDGDGAPDRWELNYFDNTEGTSLAENEDADGDQFGDYEEWIAGTDPTNSASHLAITNIGRRSAGLITLEWASVANRLYTLYMTTSLADASSWSVLADDLSPTPDKNEYSYAPNLEKVFYRVGIKR